MNEYRGREKHVKRLNWTTRIVAMILGMGSTVLLGLRVEAHPEFLSLSRNAALVCSALTTFLLGLAAFWNLEKILDRVQGFTDEAGNA